MHRPRRAAADLGQACKGCMGAGPWAASTAPGRLAMHARGSDACVSGNPGRCHLVSAMPCPESAWPAGAGLPDRKTRRRASWCRSWPRPSPTQSACPQPLGAWQGWLSHAACDANTCEACGGCICRRRQQLLMRACCPCDPTSCVHAHMSACREKTVREQERMQFVIQLDMEAWELWKQVRGLNALPWLTQCTVGGVCVAAGSPAMHLTLPSSLPARFAGNGC